jgi:hypothetical protein
MARPKHTDKDIENLLKQSEKREWRITGGGRRYFKMKCPCADKHLKMVHCSPSNPNYLRNLTNWLDKRTCWDKE